MGGPEPVLRVVRGTPTDEELAALVCALRSRDADGPPAAPGLSAWVRSGRPTAGRLATWIERRSVPGSGP